MVVFYFDTSAIVKRYHKEIGSEILDKIFELKEHGFVTSFWTILEFIVTFSVKARRRSCLKRLLTQQFHASLRMFWTDLP